MKGYPGRFLPGLVTVFVLLTATGLLLVPTALEFRFGWDVAWRLPGDRRTWVAGLHTALAFAMCGFAGALWSIHVRVGWRSRRHLASGLAITGLLLATAITSLALLYAGDETWLSSASAAHTLVGVASVAGGAVHWGVTIVERARRRLVSQQTQAGRRSAEPV